MKTRKLTKGRRSRPLSTKRRRSGSRRRTSQLEQLEDRCLLSANFQTETFFNDLSDFSTAFSTAEEREALYAFSDSHRDQVNQVDQVNAVRIEPTQFSGIEEGLAYEIDRAYRRASDLSQYTVEQLAATTQWIVRAVDDSTNWHDLTAELGSVALEPIGGFDNTYLYTPDDPLSGGAASRADAAINTLSNVAGVEYFYPLVPIELELRSLPNDPYVGFQWHLQNTGQDIGRPDNLPVFGSWGEDIRIELAWDNYTGEVVTIAIVDDSFQSTHPDLVANYNPDLAFDFRDNDTDPSPGQGFFANDFHGTAVGGVAAAVGNNGRGVAGAAYDATTTGLRLIGEFSSDFLDSLALYWMPQDIDIYNNSWGPIDGLALLSMPGPLTQQAMQWGHYLGREDDFGDALGTILVWASGNGGPGENVNYDGFANSRYTIAVNAVGHDGRAAECAEFGAPVLVSAPSGASEPWGNESGIWTTDLVGEDGYNFENTATTPLLSDGDFFTDLDYTSRFTGTSSAAPLVSGIIALILEANPGLTDRDVEQILARSARQNDPEDTFWVANGAGFHIHDIYGFGTVDALAAVQLAEDWTNVAPEAWAQASVAGDVLPPVNPETGAPGMLELVVPFDDNNNVVEWIEIDISLFGYEEEGGIALSLESPDGTVSILMSSNATGDMGNHTYTSVRHMGELLAGEWTVTVVNFTEDEGVVGSVSITAWGTEAAGDGRVQGNVALDLDGNGTFDDGEPFASNIPVFVDVNENEVREAFEPSFLTGADGNYYFDIDPHPTGGEYHIRLDLPPGYVITSGSDEFVTAVAAGDKLVAPDFLLDPDGIQITGTVFDDLDLNGLQGAEPGLAGFIVYADLDLNGVINPSDPFATTDAQGNYTIAVDAGPDFYTIAVFPQDGLIAGSPTGGFYRTYVEASEALGDLHFAMVPEVPTDDVGALAGIVYQDFDEDGILDIGEPGFYDWFVFLDINDDGVPAADEPSTRTDADGLFVFSNLLVGPYRVRTIGQPGWTQTGPGGDGSYSVGVVANQVSTGHDFGFGGTITFDYGDLPGPYPTLAEDDGPTHPIQPGFFLGEGVDGEFDGQPDSDGEGDDVVGIADEDGFAFRDDLEIGKAVRVDVTANSSGGYLQGWMDFNRDGDWNDFGERVFEDVLLDQGTSLLRFAVPAFVTAGPIYTRFRYGEIGIADPTGPALGGEVEDYVLSAINPIESPFPDGDFDQNFAVDGNDFLIWQTGFGRTSLATVHDGDADGDQDVDGDDFLIWQANFGVFGGGAGAAVVTTNDVDAAVGTSTRLIRPVERQPPVVYRPLKNAILHKATRFRPPSAVGAIRFGQAHRELDANRLGKARERAMLVVPQAVTDSYARSASAANSRRDADVLEKKEVLKETDRDELFELLAKDRIRTRRVG